MRNRKVVSAVLSIAVILGIVGCSNKSDTRVREDDIGITSEAAESLEETIQNGQESVVDGTSENQDETIVSESGIIEYTTQMTQDTSESSATSETTPMTESSGETESQEPTASPTSAPKATSTPNPTSTPTPVPTATPAPAATSTPTPTPAPANTPVPTNTPTPVPTPFDIDKSAKEKGYEIVLIDMGDGKTEKIYGYYVDMSELSTRINDYRESIGLSRLPTDTGHVSEMKTRAAEATVKFSHWRPNGRGGSEVNLSGGVDVDPCYNGLFNSDAHRAWWEDTEVFSIYCVGFRRVIYDDTQGGWVGYGGATVVFMDF